MKKLLLFAFTFIAFFALKAQDCSNLFFSEYVEGSANNKTLEIYNPTNNAVNLSTFVIKRYSNGSPIPTEELVLSGTIQPKDVVVVTNDQGSPDAALFGLDRKTGENRWRVARTAGQPSYATPALRLGPGGRKELVIASPAHGLTALDPPTGKQLWAV